MAHVVATVRLGVVPSTRDDPTPADGVPCGFLEPMTEDLVTSERVRARLADDDGQQFTLGEVGAEFGIDLDG